MMPQDGMPCPMGMMQVGNLPTGTDTTHNQGWAWRSRQHAWPNLCPCCQGKSDFALESPLKGHSLREFVEFASIILGLAGKYKSTHYIFGAKQHCLYLKFPGIAAQAAASPVDATGEKVRMIISLALKYQG